MKFEEESFRVLSRFLKETRKKKHVTIVQVAEQLDVSHPYISRVENAKGSPPTRYFVEKYLNALADNDAEYDAYATVINNDPKINLTLDLKASEVGLIQAFRNAMSGINVRIEDTENSFNRHVYDFAINDLNFHLLDNNKKYYRTIELTNDDRLYIDEMIKGYVMQKLRVQMKTVENRYQHDEINEDNKNKYIKETNELLRMLEMNEL